MKNSPLRRNSFLRRGKSLDRVGPTAKAWKKFRDEKFDRDKDEEGLVRCQDRLIGLPSCGIARSVMDLHHTQGRSGKLLFDESKMVWLTRECHDEAHNPR